MTDISYQVSLAAPLRHRTVAAKMNQDVNVAPDHSAASKRVFKFHNVNQDNIFGSRRQRREETKTKIIISSPSIEEQLRRRKAHQILQQFVPIKQKSVENKAILAPVQPQLIPAQSPEVRRELGGLRLVNLASLQEPSQLGKSGEVCLPQSSSSPPGKCQQESPLDLSNRDCEGPLDLRTKPEGRNLRPDSQERAEPSSAPSSNQPLQFLLVKNVPKPTNSFIPPLPSTVAPRGFIIPNNSQPSRPPLTAENSESEKIKKPQSLQMVFSDGRVVQVLPRRTGKQERISERKHSSSSSDSEVKLRKDPNQNEVKQKQPKKKKVTDPDLMVKTNETVTKNGDLFCTFKNVKHIKMMKEQQSRKTQKKSRKSS